MRTLSPTPAQTTFTETNPDKGTETIFADHFLMLDINSFTETNPDKGTETCMGGPNGNLATSLQKLTPIRGRKHNWSTPGLPSLCVFTETNPDKGTETREFFDISKRYNRFTETNPDKGTETCIYTTRCGVVLTCLQKLIPIRGRKLNEFFIFCHGLYISFTETNPDKGTETIYLLIWS